MVQQHRNQHQINTPSTPLALLGRDGARDRGFRTRCAAPGSVQANGRSAPRPYRPIIGAFSSAPAPAARVIVDPGFLPYRDRAALRILYRADVATTAQFTVLAYARRQSAQERLSRLYRAGYLERAILPPSFRGGAPFAFRVSPCGRRRLGDDPLTDRAPAPSSATASTGSRRSARSWLPPATAQLRRLCRPG